MLGARLDWLELDVVVPLCLMGLVGPELRARDSRSVILVAGSIALLTADWPAGTGLLAAIAGGCADRTGRSSQEAVMTWIVPS